MQYFDVPLHIASIEARPYALNYASHYACGIYELVENMVPPQHLGAIEIRNAEGACLSEYKLPSGVLDMRWRDDKWIIASLSGAALALLSVNEDGILSPYGEGEGEGEDVRDGGGIFAQKEDEGYFLSLDVTPEFASSGGQVVVSTQSSSILVYTMESGREFELTTHIQDAHSMMGEPMPAWIVALDPRQPSSFVTGGDDCTLKLWDLRSSSTRSQATNKCHDAGVTTAMFHPHREHILATGSYDEHLRIWDLRSPNKPLSTIHTGGGVWRTKWHPSPEYSPFILTASMHHGACIFEIDGLRACEGYDEAVCWSEEHNMRALHPPSPSLVKMDAAAAAESSESASHESSYHIDTPIAAGASIRRGRTSKLLCYGVDWLPTSTRERNMSDPFRFVSSSFYENWFAVVPGYEYFRPIL